MAPIRPPLQGNTEQEAKMEAANLLVSLSNTTASKSVFVPITAQPQQLLVTSNRYSNPNLHSSFCTVWKFSDFPITQILSEINFENLEVLEVPFLPIWGL